MPFLRSFLRGAVSLFRPERAARELDEEVRAFMDMAAEDQTRRQIRLEHGSVTSASEEVRSSGWESGLASLWQDLRFAARMLRKQPGFTAVAALTLALGVGANTAIFSAVYAELLKPLPYAQSDQLLSISQKQARGAAIQTGWSYPNFEQLRQRTRSFGAVAGVQRHQLDLTGRGDSTLLDAAVVTADFFALFDVAPIAGRIFTPEETNPGAAPVVMISEKLWRGQLGSDPRVLGSSIDLDKRPFTVIGIMPADFPFPLFSKIPSPPQIWIPLPQDPLFGPWIPRRGGHWLQVTGRLKPGLSMAAADAELRAVAASLAADLPAENRDWTIGTLPLQDMLVDNIKPALLVLLAAVALVLLIACANIANLLLTRATSRAREIAVRASLGAGRGRIIRQLLCESAVLGMLGGTLGIGFAYAGVRVLTRVIPSGVAMFGEIRVDSVVLLFALALSVLASLTFGVAPALLTTGGDLQSGLRNAGARSGESPSGRRARNALAVAEIALAMMLLVASGLLLRSFSNLTAVDPGFRVQNLITAEVSLPRSQYTKPRQWLDFGDALLRGVRSQPGLEDAALTVPTPIANNGINLGFDIVGRPAPPNAGRTADYYSVTPGYFRVMGIPLLKGRLFDDRDVMDQPGVTIVSRALAQLYFPNEDPIGKQLAFSFPPDPGMPRQIVGVAADIRANSLGEAPKPMMYVPYAQAPLPGAIVAIHTPLAVASVAATVRSQVAHLDRDVPVTAIASMPEIVHDSVAQPRFRTLLTGLFAAIALALAATGIFGVIAYSVARRSREIGVRVALGASRGDVLGLVSRETFTLVAAGITLGAAGALGASRLLAGLLFGVSATDPVTIVAVAVAIAVSAAAAAYVPARRAMRIDPMVALREE